MTSTSLIVLLLALCNAVLGIVVYRQDPKGAANRWFGAFALFVTLWSVGLALLYSTELPMLASTILIGRSTFAAASLLPYCFLGFAKHFAVESPRPSRLHLRLLGVLAAILSTLSFSPWMVSKVGMSATGLRTTYGPLYPVFATYFFLCLVISFGVLFLKLRRASGRTKLQLKYLYLGLFLAIGGGTTTNLAIPLFLQSSSFGAYGPLFVSLLLAFTTHAIVRYRLMDIHLVLRAGLTYILSVTLAAAAFVFLSLAFARALNTTTQEIPPALHLALALAIAISFQPLKQFIQLGINRYVFRATYDYHATFRRATRSLATTLELASLTRFLCEVTFQTFRPEIVHLYLRTGLRTYTLDATRRHLGSEDKTPPATLSADDPLLRALLASKHALSVDDKPADTLTSSAQAQLPRLGATLALPICLDDDVIGMITVGPKLSGDPYFPTDLDLFITLAAQASISLRNAQLYNEVVLANNYVDNLLATIDSGVIAISTAGAVTLFNSAAERMTGRAAASLVGGMVANLGPPISTRLTLTLSLGQQTLQEETALVNQAGQLLPVVCSTSPLRGRNGDILGAVMILSDITHLKELDAERRRAERLTSFGALASGIAHEIKNPLVAIRTFAELLPERYTDEDFRDGFAQLVVKEIGRIDGLVGRLRDLAAPTRPVLNPVDVREPLSDTLSLLRAQFEQRHVKVEVNYHTQRLLIPGDPAQLKQLFLNLFLNAMDAMESGGTLGVNLLGASTSTVSSLTVEVTDTGAGIPEAIAGRVFDPFITSKSHGSGLGLAICRGIMDAHSAAISAKNNPSGKGTTITLEFPVSMQRNDAETITN
jgi:PAS domain S-box-containing protein